VFNNISFEGLGVVLTALSYLIFITSYVVSLRQKFEALEKAYTKKERYLEDYSRTLHKLEAQMQLLLSAFIQKKE
jgi:Na+-transporting methylmalonyl-CoA/oxaloacetate decarboxylase gamma subunit